MTRRCFNMIEVLLALGVVAIGVVSVLALFPVGLSNTRDAMAETYAANAAEQLLHSIRFTIQGSDTAYDSWVKSNASWAVRPDGTAGDLDLDSGVSGAGAFGGSTLGAIHAQTDKKIYQIVAFPDNSPENGEWDGIAAEPPDFRCMAGVWGEKLVSGTADDWRYGTRVNVEISWPAELPYGRRRKRVYSLEVFNVTD